MKIENRLRVGSTGEEVRSLQQILASDPTLYPEGLVTGFYGPLTARAVSRFQAKLRLDQVGQVGPLTLAKINEILTAAGVSDQIPTDLLSVRVKIEIADWLLYACEELATIQEQRDVGKEIRKLRIRVKNGVKEELLPLLRLKGIGRVRARKLYTQGIKYLGDVKKIDLVSLGQILGRTVAEDVKKQVGEEAKEVPKGTRKGQLSIQKFK